MTIIFVGTGTGGAFPCYPAEVHNEQDIHIGVSAQVSNAEDLNVDLAGNLSVTDKNGVHDAAGEPEYFIEKLSCPPAPKDLNPFKIEEWQKESCKEIK